MFAFLLVVLLSLVSGLYLTYRFNLSLYFSERIFYGFTIAISAFTQIIYLITRFGGGLKPIPNTISLMLISLISAYCLYGIYKIKDKVKSDFKEAAAKLKVKSELYLPLTFGFWSIIFTIFFVRHLFITNEGIFARAATDMPVHMSFITSFVWGQNFPHETPLYAGEKLVYPFLSDYLTAFFASFGMNMIHAFNYPGIVMCSVFTGIMYFFSFRLIDNKKLSALSVFLLYLGGGLGFWKYFETDLPSKNYNVVQTMLGTASLYTDLFDSNFQFYNFIIAYLLPQRSFLFGFPLALVTLSLVWIFIKKSESEKEITVQKIESLEESEQIVENQSLEESNLTNKKSYEMLLAGITAGITPLFHYHSYMCVVIIVCFWFVLFFRKEKEYITNYLHFFIPMSILALPQVLMATGRISSGGQTFKIYIGWMARNNNYVWFWIKNTGFTFFLIFESLFSRYTNKPLKKLYIPFLFLFIISNLISFSPCWIGDNAKVIFYWYIGSIPFIALALGNLYRYSKVMTVTIFLTLILSSSLDISKYLFTTINTFKIWGPDQINVAKEIINKTDPKSVFLSAPIHYSPIYLTGRKVLVGEPIHVCTQGINPRNREVDIKQIFESIDDGYKLDILRRLDPDYAIIGPPELNLMKDKTFFKRFFKEYIKVGEETVYKIK